MRKRNFSSDFYINLIEDGENEEKALRIIRKFDKTLQKRTYKNVQNQSDLIVHIRENEYGSRKVVQVQFKTLGCRMKKAGSCWNCNYGVIDKSLITPNQYIKEFKEGISNIKGNVLVLESLGSITDPKEFDPNVFKEVIQIAIKNEKFNIILIETHVTQISEELVKFINSVNNGKKQIGFEIGIEDMNPENRKLINKIGVRNNKLEEVYELLKKYGMSLSINLIYGFPFMNEQERVNSVSESVKSISERLPEAEIVLYLMSIKENTIMEYMQRLGEYKPANPWGLVETTKQILLDDSIKNLITFSWFGEKEDPYINEQTCYSCNDCRRLIIEFFRNINGTFDSEERIGLLEELVEQAEESKCGCYKKFKEELKLVDGKNPRKKV